MKDKGLTFAQVTPQRSVTGEMNAFGNGGVHEYRISVGGGKRWDPARSYLSVTAELTVEAPANTGFRAPTVADEVAFADSPLGNCFQSVALLAGSVEVSQINSFAPQIAAISTRLNRSGAWLDSIGADSYGLVADFDKRLVNVSGEVPATTVTGTTNVAPSGAPDNRALANGVVATMPPQMSGQSLSDGNTQTFLWRPPLGIFDADAPLPAGSYTLQLNPDPIGWMRGMVESRGAVWLPETEFKVNIRDARFYACLVDDVTPVVSEVTIVAPEILCVSKVLESAGSQSNLEFSVPPSTYAIGIAFQATAAGTTTNRNIGRFWADLARSELKLDTLQVTFANTSKPAQNYTGKFGNAFSLKQRWHDSLVHAGDDQSGGGVERFNDWLTRGPVLYFSFERDNMDRSTQVNIQAKFDNIAAATNVLVFAFHKRATSMTVDRGFVTEVKSLAM